jgi:hypothetical protein
LENKFLTPAIALYTGNYVEIPALALLMTQATYINMRATNSLNYSNEAPLNKIMTTVKV